MSKYILSIDAGTTGITIMLFDKNANAVAKEYSEFSQIYPKPGYVEHNPIEIWNITKKCIIRNPMEMMAGTMPRAILGFCNMAVGGMTIYTLNKFFF